MKNQQYELSGFIDRHSLADLIQFLGMSQRNGELCLSNGSDRHIASIFFRSGEVTHAHWGPRTGVPAFRAILSMESGHFAFKPDRSATKSTIRERTDTLLLQYQKLVDEISQVNAFLPAEDAILFTHTEIETDVKINTLEWKVLSLINGKRNLGRICEKVGDELTAKRILVQLMRKGLVTHRKGHHHWSALTPVPVAADEVTGERPYPPLLRTNLVLKAIDGRTDLGTLQTKLRLPDDDLFQDIKLLFDTQWICFTSAQRHRFQEIRKDW